MSQIALCAQFLVALLAAAALAAVAPGISRAEVYRQDGCQIVVPSGWVTSKTRIAQPDKKVWASLMQAPTAGEALQVEQGLGAVKVSEDGRMVLMVSATAYGGLTNKQYHAITKASPSCIADVTAPAGPSETTARQIAGTVSLAR